MGRPVRDNTELNNIEEKVADELQPLELTIIGEGPDEIRGARIVARFETPSSESFLLDVGVFEDGMRKYVLSERFAMGGWKWVNSFPEMDAWQMTSYLEGNAKLCERNDKDYQEGLLKIAEELKTLETLES